MTLVLSCKQCSLNVYVYVIVCTILCNDYHQISLSDKKLPGEFQAQVQNLTIM